MNSNSKKSWLRSDEILARDLFRFVMLLSRRVVVRIDFRIGKIVVVSTSGERNLSWRAFTFMSSEQKKRYI